MVQGEPSRGAIERPPTVPFEDLAANQGRVFVTFRAQTYTLRATRNGKLILTK